VSCQTFEALTPKHQASHPRTPPASMNPLPCHPQARRHDCPFAQNCRYTRGSDYVFFDESEVAIPPPQPPRPTLAPPHLTNAERRILPISATSPGGSTVPCLLRTGRLPRPHAVPLHFDSANRAPDGSLGLYCLLAP